MHPMMAHMLVIIAELLPRELIIPIFYPTTIYLYIAGTWRDDNDRARQQFRAELICFHRAICGGRNGEWKAVVGPRATWNPRRKNVTCEWDGVLGENECGANCPMGLKIF